MVIHADSSFLVDLLRESARGRRGPASAFLEVHAADHLLASVFVACELEAGAARSSSPDSERARLRALLQPLTVVFPDERFPAEYGDLLAAVRARGRTVDTMDLLIATTAILDRAALVTANRKHFESIPGLTLLDYRIVADK
ncbi:MAG: type II toxin-antitoxin system VapC family toxin [Vicinamibacterales bacterium]